MSPRQKRVVIEHEGKRIELHDRGPAERKVKELKSELFGLRFQLATGQLQNTMRLSEVKRDIARCKTILRQKDEA